MKHPELEVRGVSRRQERWMRLGDVAASAAA